MNNALVSELIRIAKVIIGESETSKAWNKKKEEEDKRVYGKTIQVGRVKVFPQSVRIQIRLSDTYITLDLYDKAKKALEDAVKKVTGKREEAISNSARYKDLIVHLAVGQTREWSDKDAKDIAKYVDEVF